jgi:hypothetical protein
MGEYAVCGVLLMMMLKVIPPISRHSEFVLIDEHSYTKSVLYSVTNESTTPG